MFFLTVITIIVFLLIACYRQKDLFFEGINIWKKFLKESWYPLIHDIKHYIQNKKRK